MHLLANKESGKMKSVFVKWSFNEDGSQSELSLQENYPDLLRTNQLSEAVFLLLHTITEAALTLRICQIGIDPNFKNLVLQTHSQISQSELLL